MLLGGQNVSYEQFLPYPDALKDYAPPSLSKKTAKIIKKMYEKGVLLPRTWGALLELEDEINLYFLVQFYLRYTFQHLYTNVLALLANPER